MNDLLSFTTVFERHKSVINSKIYCGYQSRNPWVSAKPTTLRPVAQNVLWTNNMYFDLFNIHIFLLPLTVVGLLCIVLLYCAYLCYIMCIVLLCVCCSLTYFNCGIAG